MTPTAISGSSAPADGVIKSAGHLIGPFEVESETRSGCQRDRQGLHQPGEPLAHELLGHSRKRLGPAVAPKEIAFRPALPRTRNGKIMRRLLRAREHGLAQDSPPEPRGGAVNGVTERERLTTRFGRSFARHRWGLRPRLDLAGANE
jgi:AMP-binding enzyme C-terminal domain